jgi:hypothetical protein
VTHRLAGDRPRAGRRPAVKGASRRRASSGTQVAGRRSGAPARQSATSGAPRLAAPVCSRRSRTLLKHAILSQSQPAAYHGDSALRDDASAPRQACALAADGRAEGVAIRRRNTTIAAPSSSRAAYGEIDSLDRQSKRETNRTPVRVTRLIPVIRCCSLAKEERPVAGSGPRSRRRHCIASIGTALRPGWDSRLPSAVRRETR